MGRFIPIIALVGLTIGLVARQQTAPVGLSDYSVFYLGGRIIWLGDPNDLYPLPRPGVAIHPGWPGGSDPKPGYQALADACGIAEPFRFVYPPPSAIVFAPFGALQLNHSLVVWWVTSALACWISGLVAARVYSEVVGRKDWVWAALILGVTWCPLTWATVRVANSSALVGMAISLMLYGLIAKHSAWSAIGFYLGAILKFATIPLIVIPLMFGRIRSVSWCISLSVLMTAGAIALMGIGPFEVYLAMLPTLGLPNGHPINISALGFIEHAIPQSARPAARAIRVGALICSLALILFGLFLNRRDDNVCSISAGASALIGWFLVFAPTTQNHYFVYLFPLWGYYAAECRGGWIGRLAAGAIIGGTMVPFGGSGRGLPDPLHYHMLWAAMIALAYGLFRLFRPDRDQMPISHSKCD